MPRGAPFHVVHSRWSWAPVVNMNDWPREAKHLSPMILARNPAANSCVMAKETENAAKAPPIPFCLAPSPAGHTGHSQERIKGVHTGCWHFISRYLRWWQSQKSGCALIQPDHLLNKHSASTYYVPDTLLRVGMTERDRQYPYFQGSQNSGWGGTTC